MADKIGERAYGGNGDKATDAGDEAAVDMNGRLVTRKEVAHLCTNR